MLKGNYFSIYRDSTDLCFINDTDEKHNSFRSSKWSHYATLHKVLNFMKSRGFEVGRDPEIQKNYKCLNKDRWYGRKGDLEFKAERYPRGFKLSFFQNINYENRNGGQYDFHKFEKMPYLIRLMWINETNKIGAFLERLGISNDSSPIVKDAEVKIIDYWNKHSFNKPPAGFKLADMIGHDKEPYYNSTDRDKKTILNGQIKYFRDWHGRLARGVVYHNINNMWWVIINKIEYNNVAAFDLFDPTEEDYKLRRNARDRKPKEYTEKLESLNKLSDKDLKSELKRRGIKVS